MLQKSNHEEDRLPVICRNSLITKSFVYYSSKHNPDWRKEALNNYAELHQRQQAEFNALPLGFAFSQEQFDEMMRDWGLNPSKDKKKIYSIGAGGYVQKKDAELLRQTREKHSAEMAAAIEADKTGGGFIYEMFLYELDNHEYGYTRSVEDTLDALNYTADDINADKRLLHGLEKACAEILGRD